MPPETVKINLQISTMGLQMMGLRDALRMDETLSIPAHMMLNEEFRRPLDEARASQGTKAYLQIARWAVSAGTVRTAIEKERRSNGVLEQRSIRFSVPSLDVVHYSITPILKLTMTNSTNTSTAVMWRDLAPLMNPRSVAIIGASQRSASALNREPRGNRVIRNLKSFGYPGQIVAVNPKYSEVMDYPCYPEISAIPQPVDCVVLAVPNRQVPDLLESAAASGVRAAVVFSAGFAETGAEGKQRQARLEALSRDRGFLICGPNCYGVLNVFGKAPLFASTIPQGFLAGPVALVSQSGGLSTTIANALMLNRHVGLSHIVSCGNQAGATVEEYFNYLAEDENTRVIAGFVEGFKQPHQLLAVARKASARNKPLIILKGGRSEVSQRAAATHSGSLAGAAEVIDAAFRQSGVVSVRSINELIDAISVFSCDGFVKHYRGGRRIGVLSGSGGECTLVSDAAASVGLEVPELTESTKSHLQEAVADFGNMNNPLDGTGAMYDDEKIFPRLLQALIEDANIDVVTINLEANDPRPKELKSGNRFAQAIETAAAVEPKTHRMFQFGCRRAG